MTVLTLAGIANSSSSMDKKCSGTTVERHVAPIEFFMMVLVRFFHSAGCNVVDLTNVTHEWDKVVIWDCSCRFRPILVVTSIFTASPLSFLVALLTPHSPIWLVVTPQKLIGGEWMVNHFLFTCLH